MNNTDKVSEALKITKTGAAINIGLVILKMVLGYLGHSRALLADGLHSMTDLVSDGAVMIGIVQGSKPRDESHHYGHGKVEILAEMVLGLLLVMAGLFIAVDSIKTLFITDIPVPSSFVLPAAAVSIVGKEWLYRVTARVGKKHDMPSLIANAWHHRSDALTSVGVLIGVSMSVYFPKLAVADALVGFVVAVLIIRIGVSIGWQSSLRIIDTAPGEDYEKRIEGMILNVPGALSVREMKLRYVGNMIAVEAHLGMDPGISVREGHDIATLVKKTVMRNDARIFDVLVHMEPEE